MLINVLTAVGILGALGALLGLMLAVASRVFAVKEDPRLPLLLEALPGANCGGCGFAGCSAYAGAVVEGKTPIGGCPVGGAAVAEEMAKIMGVVVDANQVRQVAMVRCTGKGANHKQYHYEGLQDCIAASKMAGGGDLSCAYGCLGMGSCVRACPFDAIHLVDGAAKVDEEKCKGCLKCVATCPRNLITVVPYDSDVHITCMSKSKGAETRKVCDEGCIGCGLCAKACPNDAIIVADNLARIDYTKCVSCGACIEKCPRKLIRRADRTVRILP